ncbi:MAG: VanZ family protein [Firmicutes bacterium]|nr:VanZ family protein [Bacillota bacterium]
MRAKYVFPILTVLMIAFIWGHSLMPGNLSANESGILTELVTKMLHISSPNTDHYIRKCAHFFEYMILGILFSIDSVLFAKKPVCAMSLLPGSIAPQVDETIQLFTPDRGGSLFDVWLDFSGYMTGVACFNAIYAVIHRKKA